MKKSLLVLLVFSLPIFLLAQSASNWQDMRRLGDGKTYIAKKDGRFGIIQKTGGNPKIVIPARYDNMLSVTPYLLRARMGQKWTLLSIEGKSVSNQSFDFIGQVERNSIYFFVRKGSKWGAFNEKGENVYPIEYDRIVTVDVNNILACKRNECMVYQKDGTELFDQHFNSVEVNKELSVFRVRLKGKHGMLNFKGDWVFPLEYDEISPCDGDRCRAKLNGKYGLISFSNSTNVPFVYDDIDDKIRGGLLRAKLNGKWGWIDGNNKVILDFLYDELDIRDNIYRTVKASQDGKYGLLDQEGEVIIPILYDNLTRGSKRTDPCMVEKDSLYGYVSPVDGKPIGEIAFEYALKVQYGIGPVKKEGKYGAIDMEGNVIIPFLYDDVKQWGDESIKAVNGVFRFRKNGLYGLIDNQGNEILPFQYKKLSINKGPKSEAKRGVSVRAINAKDEAERHQL